MTTTLEEIGTLFKKEREKLNMKLEVAVEEIGISYHALWSVENGKDFKFSTFLKLCKFYKLNPKNIFCKRNGFKLKQFQKNEIKKLINILEEII